MNSHLGNLAHRLRTPGYWIAFLGIYLPHLGLNLWEEFRVPPHSANALHWLYNAITPFLYLVGMVWLSPLPWQGRASMGSRRWILALKALLFSECFMLGLVLLNAWFQRLAGVPAPFLDVLIAHLGVHAPAMTFVGAALALWERLDGENQEIRVLAREAQVRALQGQLHPHVLFNALNGLAELIHKDPDQAEASVRHLSDLLRKVLRATDDPDYTLREERLLLEDYLDMEGLRLGKRLHLSWDWDTVVDGMKVPPLLLQPLVENAIKHGVAPCRGGGELRVKARREGGLAVLGVWNTGLPLGQGSGEGTSVGLLNLQCRLELAFGREARFSLGSEGPWTVAELRLPWLACQETEGKHERIESGGGGGRTLGSGALVAPLEGIGLRGGLGA